MPRYDFECDECGIEFEGSYRNTKLCPICRIIRDILWSPHLSRRCLVCDEVYWPTRKSHHMCYTCTLTKKDTHTDNICGICSKKRRPAPGLENTCLECVTKTRQAREEYVKALVKRRHTVWQQNNERFIDELQ